MLHRVSSITASAMAVGALVGCSAGDASPATTTAQADTTSVQCSHGGGGHEGRPLAVDLVAFDTSSLTLVAVAADGSVVATRVTTSTEEIPTDLRSFPPDPIYPQCFDDASTYDGALGDGLTPAVLDGIARLARDGCDASIVLASDGTLALIQPTP